MYGNRCPAMKLTRLSDRMLLRGWYPVPDHSPEDREFIVFYEPGENEHLKWGPQTVKVAYELVTYTYDATGNKMRKVSDIMGLSPHKALMSKT